MIGSTLTPGKSRQPVASLCSRPIGIRSTPVSCVRSRPVSVVMSCMGAWKVRNGPSGGASSRASGRGRSGRFFELRCSVDDVPGGGELTGVEEHGDVEEPQRDLHAPVHGIDIAEKRVR